MNDDTIKGMFEPFEKPYDDHIPSNVCKHLKCLPEFDKSTAQKMSVSEIRKAFPRFSGICPDCGNNVMVYASYEHYLMGDW
jgi:hypothetical protein